MIDIFLRAETPPALRTVLKSSPFRDIIGNLTDPDDSESLRVLPGSVDYVYFPPNSVSSVSGRTDPWCWLHLRLSGLAEKADLESGIRTADRWNRSRLKRWMKSNGVFLTIRGVRVYEHALANNTRVQIWRGKDMADRGILFHEFQGGNSY